MSSGQTELLGQPQPSGGRKGRAEALKRELEELIGLIRSGQAPKAAEKMELLLGIINLFLASCEEKENGELVKG